MRLFIALEFPDDIKEELSKSARLISAFCGSGSFTLKENYHITVVFIGETEANKVALIKNIIDNSTGSVTIGININEAAVFGRDGLMIVRKAVCGKELYEIRNKLTESFANSGIPFDTKPLRPHVTMARKVTLPEKETLYKINSVLSPLVFKAKSITLMRSDRINGRLTYTPVFTKQLI